jgi:corrinoid protein of di/trimethylamine methyltransferase
LDLENIRNAVIDMDDQQVEHLVREALEENCEVVEILDNGLVAGMREVGKLFTLKEYYVPEVLLASEAFYAGFNIINPLIKSSARKPKAKVVMGVVEGDIHDIGKNIVKVMMEASGYQVIDLGKDVPTSRFVESVEKERPTVLALSSLMTTTMVHMSDIIRELEKQKLRDTVKVIVGGAPVNEDFAKKITADGYSPDAPSSIQLIERFING